MDALAFAAAPTEPPPAVMPKRQSRKGGGPDGMMGMRNAEGQLGKKDKLTKGERFLKRRFTGFDVNADGLVSLSEFSAVLPDNVEKFKQFDKNGDGSISMEESISAMNPVK